MWRMLSVRPVLARLRTASLAPLPVVGLLAAVGPLVLSAGSVATPAQQAEVAYRSLPSLPEGSSQRGAAGAEESAIALADSLEAVPSTAVGGACPAEDLRVSWEDPGDTYEVGAHVTPIGPAPDETTMHVNGIVLCVGSTYAYMGFEASWGDDDARWHVTDVPYAADESEEQLTVQPAPVIPEGPKPVPVLAAPGTVDGPIEGYAAYEPQRTCDPSAKVGTKSLAGALLRDYTGSRNLGIVRGCSVGGRSEHKEGRAFDWGVNITNANEKAAAQSFINALMATDKDGNKHALARRMGVMYVIWDRQIWSAYRASEGWRPYSGASAHRDHVHISLSWAGANGRTSFWSGTVPPGLPTASPVTANASSSRRTSGGSTSGTSGTSRRSGSSGSGSGWTSGSRQHASPAPHLSREQLRSGVSALFSDGTPPTAGEIAAWLVANGASQTWAEQYASWAVDRWSQHSAPADGDDRGTGSNDDGDGADWQQERADREAARQAERERQQEEWDARRAAEAQRRQEAQEQRQAAEEARRASTTTTTPSTPTTLPTCGSRWGHRWGGGRQCVPASTTTTVPPTTSTTAAPTTTTTAAPTTTTTAAPTTTTAAPTTTTAAPTSTTTGG
jgi:hypothetical protein